MALTGWVRRFVPFGPARRPLPPGPGPTPGVADAGLPEVEELLAALEDELPGTVKENQSMNTEPTPFWSTVTMTAPTPATASAARRLPARRHLEPWTDNDHAVEWAAFAWRRATGPG
jgi:hypothetical protein